MALAEDAVDAINAVSGAHDGHRAAHAKGTLLTGTFTATPEAAGLSRAPHLQGETLRATVRFSNGGGDPGTPDHAREGRGLAIKLYLPDGSTTDMVCLSLPVFFARTPEDFLAFTRARATEDMEVIGAYLKDHPEAGPAIQAALSAGPPESYATVAYNGIHAFRWLAPDGTERAVRYRFEPEAGEHALDDEEAQQRGADYLQEEIVAREGTAFRLLVTIAQDGDPLDDPTAAWPEDRERVEVARLQVGEPETEREQGDDVLVFDPTRVPDGIALSDDPILRFRPRAYAVSVERRSGAPIPEALAG